MAEMAVKTLRVRVKDKHAALLLRMARDVNTTWNYCNEISMKAIQERNQYLSGYDLNNLTAGYTHCDGVEIGAGTINMVCQEFAARRRDARKKRLNWRVSNQKSSGYSLGWVPFRGDNVRYRNGQIAFTGHQFSIWDSYGLGAYTMKAGAFSQDSRGRWYFNVAVECPVVKSIGTSAVGIDLGMKVAVTVSDGQSFTGRLYRANEERINSARRAKKRRLARTLHARVRNQRSDGLHKLSTKLVKENAAIFVGDVSSKAMLKTRSAKSAQDAGWGIFKTMLEYKCHQAGVIFSMVKEAYTTQTCSHCGSIEGPKGVAGLGIRRWRCSCGVEHDRDVNSAQNIARIGLDSLAVGAASSRAEKSTGEAV
jgi:putative transposase